MLSHFSVLTELSQLLSGLLVLSLLNCSATLLSLEGFTDEGCWLTIRLQLSAPWNLILEFDMCVSCYLLRTFINDHLGLVFTNISPVHRQEQIAFLLFVAFPKMEFSEVGIW